MQLLYAIIGLPLGYYLVSIFYRRVWGPPRPVWPSPMSQQWVITHDHDARQLEWWRGLRRWR
jgi:hypothetical protein